MSTNFLDWVSVFFLIIFSNCFEFKTIRELFRDNFFFFLLIMKNESESEPIEQVLRFKT